MSLSRFGKFVLVHKIGAGGMAEVYKAKAVGMDGFERTIGLKLILPQISQDQEFVKMFIREAKVSALLQHKNIVQVYDLGAVNNRYFIAMEYLEGHNLINVLKKCSKLKIKIPVPIIVFIVREIAKALQFAHEKKDDKGSSLNIIHRDISPSNILVCFDGIVKLLDFGIARAVLSSQKDQLTVTNTFKGKYSYMSPEQINGQKIDHRIDIFALGVVFYEIITMRRLFKGSNEFDTMRKVREMPITNPSKINPEIPPELDQIILKTVERDRDKRYSTAKELVDVLSEFVFNMRVSEETVSNFLFQIFPDKDLPVIPIEEEILTRGTPVPGEDSASVSVKARSISESISVSPPITKKRKILSLVLISLFVVGIILTLIIKPGIIGINNNQTQINNKNYSSVTINSSPPGAKIFINDKLLDSVTPNTLTKLAPGKNIKVKVVMEKFSPWERIVKLEANRELVLDAYLSPLNIQVEEKTIILKLLTNPAQVKVYAGEEYIGETPIEISWNKSNEPVMLSFKKDGFVDQSREIVPQRNIYLELALNKKAPVIKNFNNNKNKNLTDKNQNNKNQELVDPFQQDPN